VNADGEANFKGQIFSNPGAGPLGGLQRRMFSGPWTFNVDFRVNKVIPIREGQTLEVLMDAINAFNHATFWSGDQNINSTAFGVLGYTFYAPRIVQFGIHYKF